MKIYVTRHGQTDYNKRELMQGRIDIPLNETGMEQARATKAKIGDVKFDAVYASPLTRAVQTASIIGDIDPSNIITDERIIEADFGKYDGVNYYKVALPMTAYWALPEIFPAPSGVETVKEMVERTRSFLSELEHKDYENVLVVCHGGIIRPIRGYFENAKRGYIWRPRPKNCEIFVYESKNGTRRLVQDII